MFVLLIMVLNIAAAYRISGTGIDIRNAIARKVNFCMAAAGISTLNLNTDEMNWCRIKPSGANKKRGELECSTNNSGDAAL